MVSIARLNQHVAALLASTGGFAMGVTLGWSSLAGVALHSAIGWDPGDADLILGVVILSAAIGAVVLPLLFVSVLQLISKRTGTSGALYETMSLFVFGWLFVCLADYTADYSADYSTYYSYLYLLIGRIFSGLGIGSLATLIPLYISEISSPNHRDTHLLYFHMMVSGGIACSYFIATSVYDEDTIPLGRYSLGCAAACLPGLLCCLAPASPLQHATRDDATAREALRRLGEEEVEEEALDREIERVRALARALRTPWGKVKMLKSWQFWRAFALCACVMIFQQLSGASPIIFNALKVFDVVGTGSLTASQLTLVCGVVQIGASMIAVVLVRHVGRKWLLKVSQVFMGVCLSVLSCLMSTREFDLKLYSFYHWGPPTCLVLYFGSYSLGAGPVSWALLGDSFPLELRIPSASVIAATGWFVCLALNSQMTALLIHLGIPWTLTLFAVLCFLGGIVTHIFVGESAGKSLADIQEEFQIS